MTRLASDLRDAAATLEAVSTTPRLDAELLIAHALGMDRSGMLLRQHDLTTPEDFSALLARRMAHEPVAYIIGRQAFWDMELDVTPDVLIPRADSETLLEAAIEWFEAKAGPARIADLGTGSGALLLAALSVWRQAQGVGIDASVKAIDVAAGNATRLGFTDRCTFRITSWLSQDWADDIGRFDLLLCNPPYIETGAVLDPMVFGHEPHSALFAGPDGLDDYRAIIPRLHQLLTPGGVAFFEIGFNQAESVAALAAQNGFSTKLWRDLAGNPRVLRFSLGIADLND